MLAAQSAVLRELPGLRHLSPGVGSAEHQTSVGMGLGGRPTDVQHLPGKEKERNSHMIEE